MQASSSVFTDTLRSAIQEFKTQQEKYSLFLSKTSTDEKAGQKRNEKTIQNILNVDSVIIPGCCATSLSNSDQINLHFKKMWPLAMLAEYSTKNTRIGFTEEHGTLWKFVEKKDHFPGFRALLLASEVEENQKFLGPGLQLVSKENAIIWNIKIANRYEDGLSSKNVKNDNERGVFVQLENVGSLAKGLESSKLTQDENIEINNSFLAYEHTDVVNSNALLLSPLPAAMLKSKGKHVQTEISRYYQHTSNAQGLDVYKSFVWEIIPESWISNDLEFLDEFVDK